MSNSLHKRLNAQDSVEWGAALHGGQVDTVGWVGAFVPCVHLGGRHTLLVSIHLDLNKKVRIRSQGRHNIFCFVEWAKLTMSELKGFTLMFRMELLVRDHTLVLCLKAALTYRNEPNNNKHWWQMPKKTVEQKQDMINRNVTMKTFNYTSELSRQWNKKTKKP